MVAPRTVRRLSGGLALEVDALRIPGGTEGHVLTLVDDGDGGMEAIPQAPAGGGLPTATQANQVLVSPAPGSTYNPKTMAELRALLFGPTAIAMAGSGWSMMPATGGASASWADGKLYLDVDGGSVGFCGVEHPTLLPSTERCAVALRVQITSGDNSASPRFVVVLGRDDENTINFALWSNGQVEPAYVEGGVYHALVVASAPALTDVVRTGGELWFLITRTHDCVSWKYGINAGVSGTLPTRWVSMYSTLDHAALGYVAAARNALNSAQGKYFGIVGLTTGGAVDFDVTVHEIRVGQPEGV